MAEYLIQEETLISIADPIRKISGVESKMHPSEIAIVANDANSEVNTQAELISQIVTLLEEKASATIPDGLVELPTLTNPGTASDLAEGMELIDFDGNVVTGTLSDTSNNLTSYSIIEANTLTGNYKIGIDVGNSLEINYTFDKDIIFRSGKSISLKTPAIRLGNATAKDVANGKTFTSSDGLMVEGSLITKTIKTGTTTSSAIDTGLSSVDYITIYKSSVDATGFVQGVYRADTGKTTYTYCSSYSTFLKQYSVAEDTNGTVNGGTFTWGGTNTQALSSGTEYNWIAVGTE